MDLKQAIICDIDGTIADKGNRDPYDYDNVGLDTPKKEIIKIIQWAYSNGIVILYVSGRDDCCYKHTADWIDTYVQTRLNKIWMRKNKDNRKDSIVKREIYDQKIKDKYEVLFVLDDRNQTVKMWRQLGLTCLQVADGDF